MAHNPKLAGSARPRVRSFVYFAPTAKGVVFRTWTNTFVLNGQGLYDLLERLAPMLDGSRTVAELLASVPTTVSGKISALIEILLEREVLTDDALNDGESLAPEVQARYSASLAYLDSPPIAPVAAFASFRESRVLIVGSGMLARATARALFSLGLRELTVSVPLASCEHILALEHDFAEHNSHDGDAKLMVRSRLELDGVGALDALTGFDLVLHVDADSTTVELKAFDALCRQSRVRLLQATIVSGWGVVTPVLGFEASCCWDCIERRVVESGAVASEIFSLFLGNSIAFSAFRMLAGIASPDEHRRLLTLHPDSYEMSRRVIVPHACCAIRTPQADRDVTVVRSFSSDVSPAAFLEAMQAILDPVVGVITLHHDNIDQVPLAVVRAARSKLAPKESACLGYGLTPVEAHYHALRRSLEIVVGDEMHEGLEYGESLVTGQARTLPDGYRVISSGHSFAEWIGRGLLASQLKRSPATGFRVVSDAAFVSHDARRWLRVLRTRYHLNTKVFVRRLELLDAAVATVVVEGQVAAVELGRDVSEAVSTAMLAAVALIQSAGVAFDTSTSEGATTIAEGDLGVVLDTLSQVESMRSWDNWTEAALVQLRDAHRDVVARVCPGYDLVREAGLLVGAVGIL
ncbi:MAG: hypothetical protein ACK5XE_02100 [Burkholderiales bacterium]